MEVTRVVVTSGGDKQPLVSSPASLAPSSPGGMPCVHQCEHTNGGLLNGGDSVRTTHFPALRHDSPTKCCDARSSLSSLGSPTQSPTAKHQQSSYPKVLHASPLTNKSTPSRRSHNPYSSPVDSGSFTSRHSHPAMHSPSNGITLMPASHDTSTIIHEKNKSVTIVLGEQQVTYSTPSHQAVPKAASPPNDDQFSLSRASHIVRITGDSTAPKINSVTCIDTTNDVDTLKSKARLDRVVPLPNSYHDKSVTNPIMTNSSKKLSYNSTAFTSSDSSPHSSTNGAIKSWQDVYSTAHLQEDACEDWRRSTSTLVPSVKFKSGKRVTWRGVACLVSGAALVASAAAMLRLPGLIIVYGAGSLVPVLVACLLLVAAPLALLEAGLAQFSSCSVLAVWRLLPLARGIGWSLVLLCALWGVYAAGLTAPWLHYFLVTTAPPAAIQSVEVGNCSWAAVDSADAALHYYRSCVYGTSAVGGVGFNWPLPAGVLAVCFCAFLGSVGGVALQASVSGVALAVALTGEVTQGCLVGWQLLKLPREVSFLRLVTPLVTPNVDIVSSPQIWLACMGQSLLMLGPGTALLLNHASHFHFRFRLKRHISVLTALSVLVTLLVAVVTLLQMSLIRAEDPGSHSTVIYARRAAQTAPSSQSPITAPSSHSSRTAPSAPHQLYGGLPHSSAAISLFKVPLNPTYNPLESEFVTTGVPEETESLKFLGGEAEVTEPIITSANYSPVNVDLEMTTTSSASMLSVLPRSSIQSETSGIAAVSSSDLLTSRELNHNALYNNDGTSESNFIGTAEMITEASPLSTTCLYASSESALQASTPASHIPSTPTIDHCILNSIKHGASGLGLCAHQEVSVGGVFLLMSHSLMYDHESLEWLRPVLAAIILCGILCCGLSSVCATLCVAAVAGRESSQMTALVGAGVMLLVTLLGVAPLVAQGGHQLLSLLDLGVLTPALVWPAILMTLAIAAAHGMGKIRKDFIFMLEKDMSVVWAAWWAFVIPLSLVGLFVWQCVDWWRFGYVYRVHDIASQAQGSNDEAVLVLWWQMALIWTLRALLLLPIPVVAIRVINSQLAYGIKDKLVSALQSSREWGEWGPQDPIEHHNWRRWREDETRPFASLERRLANRPLTYTHSTLSRNSSGGSSLSKLRAKYQKKEPIVHAVATAL
ncbi:uncharacterized protein LOC108674959 [Hyalella azteca]|uniref:Sodium-dependent nutrient amino acid transporter 1 n=1 Tax=Hyalella azteca TaxID=294128 RepID=A0A8B7NXA8_HYAAZ|nr:uncharacterized protein LOC108674959 [Hyalella azteca]